ncbi:TIGR00266 family protein [Haladaptatus sp. F3-133]|jgi:uncharacterized protein (TIGR00266 family)|uniref:TIGR00266 family protein n=1 Tax=Halorutilus salinus TaxID=2487751 RepID=A0A9Q4GIY0_9EURY|nr:TIGR00266 family protein [Halorutilus salinus]MCX2818706.1 TIGR00266 family protein [Halorutilus salinus]
MEVEFKHRPSFTHIVVQLNRGESISAEPGALVGHSSNVSVNTTTSRDGLVSSAKSMLGGESAFVNEFVAEGGAGEVELSPPTPGDIMQHQLEDETLYAADGAFLAASDGVDIDSEIGGVKSMIGGAGLTPLALKGTGTAFVDAYGGLETLDLGAGETYTLDNANLVAWDDSVEFSTRRVGDLKSSLLSGEGLVFDFEGPGRAWYQTRDFEALADALKPYLPTNGQ